MLDKGRKKLGEKGVKINIKILEVSNYILAGGSGFDSAQPDNGFDSAQPDNGFDSAANDADTLAIIPRLRSG
jgi:hypothetical protein